MKIKEYPFEGSKITVVKQEDGKPEYNEIKDKFDFPALFTGYQDNGIPKFELGTRLRDIERLETYIEYDDLKDW